MLGEIRSSALGIIIDGGIGRAASATSLVKTYGVETTRMEFSRDYSTPGSSPVQEPAPPGVTGHRDYRQAPAR